MKCKFINVNKLCDELQMVTGFKFKFEKIYAQVWREFADDEELNFINAVDRLSANLSGDMCCDSDDKASLSFNFMNQCFEKEESDNNRFISPRIEEKYIYEYTYLNPNNWECITKKYIIYDGIKNWKMLQKINLNNCIEYFDVSRSINIDLNTDDMKEILNNCKNLSPELIDTLKRYSKTSINLDDYELSDENYSIKKI